MYQDPVSKNERKAEGCFLEIAADLASPMLATARKDR